MSSRPTRERNADQGPADSIPKPWDGADGDTGDLREANENIRKAQGDDAMDTPVDPKKAGNKPRFDRDR